MAYGQKTYSQALKEGNRLLILMLLKDGPKRFRELQKQTGLTGPGLAKILKELESKDKPSDAKITKNEEGTWPIYELTNTGKKEFHDAFTLPHTLAFIERNGGHLHQDYSDTQSNMWFCYLPWGIRDDLALSKEYDEKSSPLPREFVKELQLYIYKKLKANLKQKDLKQLKEKKGQIVLGFDIDVSELAESLEMDVLKERENVTEKQMELFSRFQNGKETKEDEKKLGQILKERSEKS